MSDLFKESCKHMYLLGLLLLLGQPMVSIAQPAAPYNLQVWVEYGSPSLLYATWECEPDSGFEFFLVKRNGTPYGTSTSFDLIDILTSPSGTYCLSVQAYYDQGYSYEITGCATWGASHLSLEPDFHADYLNPGDTLLYYINLTNNGSTDLSFSFPDFVTGTPPPGFITSVSPASGIICPDGGVASVAIRWDAAGYGYNSFNEQDLVLNTSDLTYPVATIRNEMNVIARAFLTGYVYDSLTNQPVAGVDIGIDIDEPFPFYPSTKSLHDGSYVVMVGVNAPPVIECRKSAYTTRTMTFTGPLAPGDTGVMDLFLNALPYPVPEVTATVNYPDEDFCLVQWAMPSGEEEIINDDGNAEDYFSWTTANNENAVRFTPAGYPAKLTGGKVYIGEGNYPAAYWLYREFTMLVYDEGSDHMPGSLLDSVGVLIYHHGWIAFDGLDAQIDSGDFFISMKQVNPFPNTAPIGIDNTAPTQGRSYQKTAGGAWSVSTYQDFMIRATLDEPSPTALSWLRFYDIQRAYDFDPPAGPESGTLVVLDNIIDLAYFDGEFSFLPPGWYAYKIIPVYEGTGYSYTYSNIVGHALDHTVTFVVSDCLLGPVEGFVVSATGLDWPYEHMADTTDLNGMCVFNIVWEGEWDFNISKCGYEDYNFNDYIFQDITYEIIPDNKFYKPRDLTVDSVTGKASWNEPMITALLDDFDEQDIYTNGWQTATDGNGWIQTDDGGSMGFFIPPTGSTYMCVNDNAGGAGNDGCCDMLITPEIDLCEADEYILSFDSYFTGAFGQTATLEYSTDTGQSWTVLYSLSPVAGIWEHIEIDLSAFSGANSYESIHFAFHANDEGGIGSGWAIDNVDLKAGPANASTYFIYLDGVFVSTADTTSFLYPGLSYGHVYQSGVAAMYDCGLSDETNEFFISGYLAPPYYLEADSSGNDVELFWVYDSSTITGVMPDVLGFNIYRDSINIAIVPYTGDDTSYYTDVAPDPMCYYYHVSTLYDLSLFTFPGDTGESLLAGPAEVCLVYGSDLPYFEDWSTGMFEPGWTAGQNWVINGQSGNPDPSAEFSWDPILINYEECLVSGPINGVFPGTKSDPYADGKFLLKFDLQLVDMNSTGTEYFRAEVWSNGSWYPLVQFDNADGSFEWETVEADITEYAMGQVFKLRFIAGGNNSSDILSWFIDNIVVYHYCAPPTNLLANWEEPYISIRLDWNPPVDFNITGDRFQWGVGNNLRSRGLLGYNLYLELEGTDEWEFLDFTTDTTYIYEYAGGNNLWFNVTSVYESCESEESNTVWIYIGIDHNSVSDNIQIFPNPAHNSLNINSEILVKSLSLLDISGQILQRLEAIDQKNVTLDVSSLVQGIYLLKIETEGGIAVSKVVLD